MLELFRRNLFLNSLLLLPIVILFRLRGFFDGVVYKTSLTDTLLSRATISWISSDAWQSLIACLLVFFQALLINKFIIKNNLSKDITLISGLIYVSVSSMFYEFGGLSPVVFANTFVVLSISQIFKTYNNANVTPELFLSGFFMSLAAAFYTPYILFFIFTNLAFIIMRSYTKIERLQHLLGWICTYFLIFTYQYLVNDYRFSIPYDYFNQVSIFRVDKLSIVSWIFLLFVIICAIIFVLNGNKFFAKRNNAVQKKISILFWLMLFSGMSLLLYKYRTFHHTLAFCISACYFSAMIILRQKNKMFQELVYILIVIIAIFSNLGIIQLS
jgi:hypothetical protein